MKGTAKLHLLQRTANAASFLFNDHLRCRKPLLLLVRNQNLIYDPNIRPIRPLNSFQILHVLLSNA